MKTFSGTRAVLFSLCLAVTTLAHAEPHTFRNADGRTLEAEIVAATPDMVTLKLATGPTLAAQISKFSSSDQEYISVWRKEHPIAIKYAFAASYTKDKTNSSKKKFNNVTTTSDTWVCNMKITNRSGQTLENAKINYTIYYNQVEDRNVVLRKVAGEAPLDVIKHLQELIIPTNEVKLTTSQLEGGYYYTDGSKSKQRDALVGMTIAISHEGKQVFTWSSTGVPAGGSTPDGKTESLFGK